MRARRPASLLFLTVLFLSTAGRLGSQQPPAPRPGQGENPLTTDQHRRLAFLAGQWEEEINYAEAQAGQRRGRGRWLARPALGLYLQIQYKGTSPTGPYRAFGVLTYDREEQIYRLWWFDDAGIGEYRGEFTDENTLVLEHRGKVQGRDFRERIRYTRVSPTEVRTQIEQAWGTGEFKPYLEAVAHRAGEGPSRGPGRQPPKSEPPGKEPNGREENDGGSQQ